jgi:hypothetical protein
MHAVLATHVEGGNVPGLIALVSRRGEVHVDAIGTRTAGGHDAMQRDTIFRILLDQFQNRTFEISDEARGGQWSRPPAFPSGAGRLVSTADDYLAFGLMMLQKGKHGRERILSRPSVELRGRVLRAGVHILGAGACRSRRHRAEEGPRLKA